jgi:hypothetical protein
LIPIVNDDDWVRTALRGLMKEAKFPGREAPQIEFSPRGERRRMGLKASPFRGRECQEQVEAEVTHREKMLDEALEETFPASDPVSVDVRDAHLPSGP